MATFDELFKVIKFKPFIETYTVEKITGGIAHRKSGKGTRPGDKNKNFTEDDKVAIKTGLEKMVTDIHQVINTELS